MTKKLTEKEYKDTMTNRMVDITEKAESVVDIWDYVGQLTRDSEVLDYVNAEQLVEKVYRSDEGTFDHVLLPTEGSNVFIVIVVNLKEERISGHFRLDLNEQYGIEQSR